MIRAVVIGAGNIAQSHLQAMKKLENVSVEAIVDLETAKADNLKNQLKLDAEVAADYSPFLASENIDLVSICLPTFLHKKVAMEALEAGKHVICEKPIALTEMDAKEMYKTAERKCVHLFIGHVVRFMTGYQTIKKQLNQMGNMLSIRMTRAVKYPSFQEQNWYKDSEKSGGPYLDFIIHDLDYLIWLQGKPEVVFSGIKQAEDMQLMIVILKYNEGPLIRLEGIWSKYGYDELHQRVEIEASRGNLIYDTLAKNQMTIITKGRKEIFDNNHFFGEDPFYEEIRHFINVINKQEEHIIKKDQVLDTLSLAIDARNKAVYL